MKEIELEKLVFENAIKEFKKSTSQIDYLTKAYNYLVEKYQGSIKGNIFNFFDLFLDKNKISQKRFLTCTSLNYLMKIILIEGGFFKPEDIKLKWTLLWYFSPHQYLEIKTGENIIKVDLWANYYGIKFGDYAHGFYLRTK